MDDRRTLRVSSATGQCLQFFDDNSVKAAPCAANSANQQWRVAYDGSIAATGYTKFGKCLTASSTVDGTATLQPCKPGTTSQVFRSSVLVTGTKDVVTANGVCLNYAGTGSSATTLSCHGNTNQLWSYTFEEEIRSDDNCLQYDEANLATVTMGKCSGESKQKWTLDAASGKVTPSAKPARCLDFTNYAPVLTACSAPVPKTQAFNVNALFGSRDRNLKRTMVQAPGVYTGNNCVTVNRATKDVHIAPCSKNVDMWWEITSTKAIKLAGEQCVDLSLSEAGRVTYSTCTGSSNQQWTWNSATGVVASVAQPDKCLTFSIVNVTAWESVKFSAQTCGSPAPRENQVLRPRDFTDILPPYSRTEAQASFCSQRKTRASDLSFLRDTLFWAKKDLKALVPATLAGREEYNYYESVVMESVSAVMSVDANWLTETEIVDKLGAIPNGIKALFDLSEMMCVVRERSAELKPKISDLFATSKPDNKRLLMTVNYLRVANLQLQLLALPADSVLLGFVSDHIAKSVDAALQGHLSDNDLIGLNQFVSSSDMSWFAGVVQPLCTAKPAAAICSATYFPGLIAARQDLLDELKTTTVSALKTNEIITIDVLTKAESFMDIFHKGLAAGSPVDKAVWQSFAQLTMFGAVKPVASYNQSDLLRTTTNTELMMVFSMWPHFSADEMSSTVWNPFFTALSDQFYAARRTLIGRMVFSSRVQTLEAYFDGRSSDMDALATQVLPRVCVRFPSFKACELIKFHSLTNARAELQRRISATGRWTSETEELAAAFAKTFGAGSTLDGDLWTAAAVRLLFNSTELRVYPAKELLTTATPDAFLALYAVFMHYSPSMASLLPYFTFLVNQVSTAHFNAINALVAARDIDGMAVYLDPQSNSTTSDLGVLGGTVLPAICNNPNNPEFSICKLQEFYYGLNQVLAFEKSRYAAVVSLEDVAEVDVRKQLDVIDAENKQFEIITAIQDSANQIGQKIDEESTKIQAVVAAESAAIRADIAASTQVLYDKMGEEGRALQAQIEDSTRILEDTIGDATDDLRREIAENTNLLYNKMDDDARALQRSIDENTQKLSTQIGAEAKATRQLVNDATSQLYNKIGEEGQAIRGKIDESTNKLYNKIGEESQAIRTKIDQSTDKLYNKIGEEGQLTRNKIDESTRTLTSVINTSTAKLEGKIAESTSTVVGTFKSGFTALADYYKSDAKVNSATILAQIQLSVTQSKKLQGDIQTLFQPFVESMKKAIELVQSAAGAQNTFLAAQAVIHAATIAIEAAKCFNPFALIFGGADPMAAAQAAEDLAATVGKMAVLHANEEELKRRAEELATSISQLTDIANKYLTMQKKLGNVEYYVKLLSKTDASLTPTESSKLTDMMISAYKQYDAPVSQMDIESIQGSCQALLDHMQNMVDSMDVGVGSETLTYLRKANDDAGSVFSTYLEILGQMSSSYEKLAQAARAAVNTQSANNLANVASNMGKRRLQAGSTFKPFYSMAYAGLSKLFMQYKIQQGAFQFCKFYEYKLGGTPPSMCGSTKFYTATDIQKMRAYQPPAFKALPAISLLPTQPTVSDDAISRPYLDLDRLLKGEKVTFKLPQADLAWLKQYSWIYRSDTAATLAGVYIQSMQIVLPFTSTSNDSSVFDMAVTVDISAAQRLNAQNEKMYVVPATKLKFSSAFNAPLCAVKITNPYHEAAKCVKSDGASNICVYDNGEVARTDILPSLFSLWQISMPSLSSPGRGYKLALPSTNRTSAPEFNVVALLNVVRITSAATSSKATESIGLTAESQCCAGDTYLAGTVCTACPQGTTGALNGYTCQRA
uniref:Ricin B lectin domain-containing protein n=1 Tax=Globisporangium ultimum (strain ATCC 200006 / CBS 805.95 / DAOM BR144) TaxID=431595 RepID=K3WEN8_GLOUD